MFSKMRDRFNPHGGKARLVVAALVCAAGLGLGTEGTTVLAQLTGGNPQLNLELPANMVDCVKGSSCDATFVNPVSCSYIGAFGACTYVVQEPQANYTCSSLYPDPSVVCSQATVAPCTETAPGTCIMDMFGGHVCNPNLANESKAGGYTTCSTTPAPW